jgi:hypothetical protein
MQVDAVFHSTAFADRYNLPSVGTKARTDPPAEFCLGATVDDNCEAVDLSILAITDTTIDDGFSYRSQVRLLRMLRLPRL